MGPRRSNPALFAGKPSKRGSSRWRIAVIAGIGICVVLTLSVSAGYYFLGRNPPQDPPLAKTAPVADDPKKRDVNVTPNTERINSPPPPKKSALPLASERWPQQFVEALNRHRKSAGLASVSIDAELSRACLAHAKYLAQNAEQASVLSEDSAKPGYSVEGERAAAVATIAFAEPIAALERWMGQLVNRPLLFDPEVRSIGLGFAQKANGEWISLLDAQRGRGGLVVVYPAPQQAEVPLSHSGGPELPDGKTQAGFPITVVFPPGKEVTDGQIELRDDKGVEVEGGLWTASETDAHCVSAHALALSFRRRRCEPLASIK